MSAPSVLVAQAVARHQQAATAAEERQAASELADVDETTRPQGSWAQVHSVPAGAIVAVPDSAELTRLGAT